MTWQKWLIVLGLVTTLLGAGFGFWGVWVTEDQAIEIGVSRLTSPDRAQELQLPAVQNLLWQSRCAMAGFAAIGLGTILQGIGVICTPRR